MAPVQDPDGTLMALPAPRSNCRAVGVGGERMRRYAPTQPAHAGCGLDIACRHPCCGLWVYRLRCS